MLVRRDLGKRYKSQVFIAAFVVHRKFKSPVMQNIIELLKADDESMIKVQPKLHVEKPIANHKPKE